MDKFTIISYMFLYNDTYKSLSFKLDMDEEVLRFKMDNNAFTEFEIEKLKDVYDIKG